jgi:hypothetical protein
MSLTPGGGGRRSAAARPGRWDVSAIRPILALVTLCLATGAASAGVQTAAEVRSVSAARRVSVSRLDPSLPRMRLDSWLRLVLGPQTRIAWETNDCGEGSGSPSDSSRDLPVCAEASATLRGGATLYLSVAVGSLSIGVHGAPSLWDAVIVRGDSTESFRSLARFARAIRARRR